MKLLEIIEVNSLLGESPLWDERLKLLYWIDIHGERLGVLTVSTGKWVTWPTGRRFGSIALTSQPGQLLAATATGLEIIAVTDTGLSEVAHLAQPEAGFPHNRFNDGKTDRRGRFWAGTMDDHEIDRIGAMYRLDIDGAVTRAWGDIGIPNGLCFSPDGHMMYTADSTDRMLWVAPYNLDSGQPAPRRFFANVDSGGSPDGSTVDAAGMVWNAEWGASRLVRYRPNGVVDTVLEVPVEQPSCVAFGGDQLELMFITSARVGLMERPQAGALLVYDAGVSGIAETPYPLSS